MLKTISIESRNSLVHSDCLGIPLRQECAREFLSSLPTGPTTRELLSLSMHICEIRSIGMPVILFCGGHVIKVGLTPIIIDLFRRQLFTHLAVNGSVLVHDYELSVFGKTSEDVNTALRTGTFGVTAETSEFINKSVNENANSELGLGTILAKRLANIRKMTQSLLGSVIPFAEITVHTALGADVVHMDDSIADWGNWARLMKIDFDKLTESVRLLDGGGAVVFIGSAVILPEIFLKAVAINRNRHGKPYGIIAAAFDMNEQYRIRENVITRPAQRGFYIKGPTELTVPIFAAMLSTGNREVTL